jgi:hypothetical protein
MIVACTHVIDTWGLHRDIRPTRTRKRAVPAPGERVVRVWGAWALAALQSGLSQWNLLS